MYHNIPIMIKYRGHFIAFCYCVQKLLLTLLVCCTITEFCCFFLTSLEKKDSGNCNLSCAIETKNMMQTAALGPGFP